MKGLTGSCAPVTIHRMYGRWICCGGLLLAACATEDAPNGSEHTNDVGRDSDAGGEGMSPDTPEPDAEPETSSEQEPSGDDDVRPLPEEPETAPEEPEGVPNGGDDDGSGGSDGVGPSGDGGSGVLDAGSTAPDVAGDAGGGAPSDAGGEDIEWTDVVPTTTRMGPQTAPRILFSNEEQLGGYWETPSGDVITSFRTSVTQPEEGIALYDWHYTLRTIVGDVIEPVPDVPTATCRYQDWPYIDCEPGPDYWETKSLVANDGTILFASERWVPDDTVHPLVEALDPLTGTFSPIVELTELSMPESEAYAPQYTLMQLADDTIALAASRTGAPARTAVFDTGGAHLADRDGFAFGQRHARFALFVGETHLGYNQRFDWWDPRIDASARAWGFPEPTGTAPSFRTFVTPVGNVVFPGFTHNDRLMHIDEAGDIVEDREMPAWNFHGVLPDGRYLVVENDETLGYVLRVYDRAGVATDLYDEATLVADAGWPAFRTDASGTYPHLAPLEFATVIDDVGTAYVGFVLQTGGETSQTYLAAFASDGQKLWGMNLERTGIGSCLPERVLSGRRLVVRCFDWYLRRFQILGE